MEDVLETVQPVTPDEATNWGQTTVASKSTSRSEAKTATAIHGKQGEKNDKKGHQILGPRKGSNRGEDVRGNGRMNGGRKTGNFTRTGTAARIDRKGPKNDKRAVEKFRNDGTVTGIWRSFCWTGILGGPLLCPRPVNQPPTSPLLNEAINTSIKLLHFT